ncbi:RNA methyltransferase [Leptolyngbya sp. FACHB-36]|uniref:TrmH family RNA methyltransferase n=1 Tax=Leptolyngbya sp. FACHB-36 TaxID=2692808 RepID=UPI0016816C18|nr:RNA methyltransferase [Leptolyngbya sp. FACHB-36]MBD2020785.1 RNA methyltransferase [Leptolyngbya sp. FACHB-36]
MLTSLQNSLVKQMRKLHRAKERQQQQLFLLEGTHLLEAACVAQRQLVTLCYTEDWQRRHAGLWEWAARSTQRVELVSPEVLRVIATTVEPDGVVATLERTSTPPPSFKRLGLVLETVQDPGNLGTMIRTAAAVGADGLLVSADSVDLDHPKVLRASAGQWFQLPMAASRDFKADLARYQQQGMQVIATLPTATLSYWQVDLRQPTLILLGNEGAGLSPDLADMADRHVTIPLSSGVESLNVAIAAALILYEAKRQCETVRNTE